MAYQRNQEESFASRDELNDYTLPPEVITPPATALIAPDGTIPVSGEPSASVTIETNGLSIGGLGHIRSGQTNYNTGTGWWIGSIAGTPKLSIGNPSSNYLTWDGSTLSLVGNFNAGTTFTAGEAISSGQAVAAGINLTGQVQLYNSATSSNTNVTSASISFDAGSNSNRILLVALVTDNTRTISAPTYNGVSLTQLDNSSSITGTVWSGYLIAPTSGTNNLALTFSGTTDYAVVIYSYYNVDQGGLAASNFQTMNALNSGTTSASTVEAGDYVWTYYLIEGATLPTETGVTIGTGDAKSVTATNFQTVKARGGAYGHVLTAGTSMTASWGAFTGGANFGTAVGVAILKPASTMSFGYVVKASAAASGLYSVPSYTSYRQAAFIGFAQAAAAAGSNVVVTTAGTVTGLSSLTPLTDYYLSDVAGSLSTVVGTNTRKAGIALTTTQLLVTNIW